MRATSPANSPAYTGRTSERAAREAAFIRERLSQGDLRVGDRLLLTVEGEILPDTIAVETGPSIDLPTYGRIPLQGVLRSELESHLATEIGRFILDPVVRAQALIRVSIQGPGVGAPGFYTLPAEMLVGEAIMRAGGPLGISDLEQIEIFRGDVLLWSGIETRDAIVDGYTLDQLNLRGGDELRVPIIPQNPWWRAALQFALPVAISLVLGVGAAGGF